MGSSLLTDRGVLEVAGPEAETFLHRLVTNSVLALAPGEARYAGLLSPQGKLLFDFIVVALPDGGGFYLDCVKAQAQDLARKLNFLKLRAKVTVADRSETLAVAAFWDAPLSAKPAGLAYTDPRAPGLGSRVIAPPAALVPFAAAHADGYEAHRIAVGVGKGGLDFPYGDTFVHDANMDLTHGVDFKKGCYVGQEVVARVQYRKSARKRIVKVQFDGAAPAPGTQILAGDMPIGEMGSAMGSEGLAMVRLDRFEEAKAAGAAFLAGGARLEIMVPPELLASATGGG